MNRTLIRERRKALGLTQHALAEQVGCVQSVVAELESGTRDSASILTLKRLALALGVTLDALTSDPTPEPQAATA